MNHRNGITATVVIRVCISDCASAARLAPSWYTRHDRVEEPFAAVGTTVLLVPGNELNLGETAQQTSQGGGKVVFSCPGRSRGGGIATEEAWKPAGALMIASDAEKPPRTESPASSGLKSMVLHTIDFQTHESMSQPTEHFIWRMRSNTVLPS